MRKRTTLRKPLWMRILVMSRHHPAFPGTNREWLPHLGFEPTRGAFGGRKGRRPPVTSWVYLAASGIITEPLNHPVSAGASWNGTPIFPFGNRPHISSDDLGKLPKRRLERNPPSPHRLNERCGHGVRMEGRHVVVTARQNSVFQVDTPL